MKIFDKINENLSFNLPIYKETIILFFQNCLKGFLKEKSFDDKLN